MICRQFSHFTHSPSVLDVLLPRSVQLAGFAFKPSHKNSSQYSVLGTQFKLEAATACRFLSTEYWVLRTGCQYSIPLCAITPFSYACFTWRISVTVSAASTIVGCAFRPVKMTCTISGFFFRLSTTFAGSSMP